MPRILLERALPTRHSQHLHGSTRTWPVLVLLALGTFTVGTSELVISGILPILAADLGASFATAGWLVTGYALAFATVTPLVATRTGRLPRRPVLLSCLVVFVLATMLAALAPNLGVLMLARITSAVAAGVFEVAATAAAAALVPERQRGRAIALVVAGFSVALVVGVPAGTLVGLAFGWRASFGVTAVLGVVATLGLRSLLPAVPLSNAPVGPESQIHLLRHPAARLSLVTTAVLFTGAYTVATYIAPFLEQVTGLSDQSVAGLLLLVGVTSTAGNIIGGFGTDRLGEQRILLLSCTALALSLALFSLLGSLTLGVVAAVGVCGLMVGVFLPIQQSRLVALLPAAADLGLALNLAARNIGIALGAAIGGAVIDRGGLAILGYVGASIVTLAVLNGFRYAAPGSFRTSRPIAQIPEPRELVAELEACPRLPTGLEERFAGYGVMGQPFRSGHLLAMRRFPASSIGPGYRSVWHRDPHGHWTFFQNVAPERACTRYFGAAVDDVVDATINVDWSAPRTFSITVAGGGHQLAWSITLTSSGATRLLNAIGSVLPERWRRSRRFLAFMAAVAGPMVHAGKLGLSGRAPNGQRFSANPLRVWLIADTTAVLDGVDLGETGPAPTPGVLGDFRIPQRGMFAIGRAYFDADSVVV